MKLRVESPASIWRRAAGRPAIAVIAVLLLLVAVDTAFEATTRPAVLGIRVAIADSSPTLAWVVPGAAAWDQGARPGDRVVTIEDRAIGTDTSSAAIESARALTLRSTDGALTRVSVEQPHALAGWTYRLTFLLIAMAIAGVGVAVYALSRQPGIGFIFFGMSYSAAMALTAAIATPFGVEWATAATFLSVLTFGFFSVLFAMVFPIDRTATAWGRSIVLLAGALTAVQFALRVIAFVTPAFYEFGRRTMFGLVGLELVGAGFFGVTALLSARRRGRGRRSLSIIVIGTIAGIAPLSILSLLPRAIAQAEIVPPEAAAIGLALIPLVFGGAILSRQFLGIDRLVRRGTIAIAVWLILIGLFTVAIEAAHGPFDRLLGEGPLWSLVVTAFVTAAFWPLQSRLRFQTERLLFRDVYDYAETVQRLGADLSRMTGMERIATYVLKQLGQVLDLKWASLLLKSGDIVARFEWSAEVGGSAPSMAAGPASSETAGGEWTAHPGLEVPDRRVVDLISEATPVGSLELGPKRHDVQLSATDDSLLAAIVPLIATTLRNALLVERLERQVAALKEREEALEKLGERFQKVQDDERRALALDLHDDALQRTITLARQIDAVTLPGVAELRREAEDIVASLRAICSGLWPTVLDDIGLAGGLQQLANDCRARSELEVDVNLPDAGSERHTDETSEMRLALYRVVQEALNNTMKHANARRAIVTLGGDRSTVVVRVEDDGRGIAELDEASSGKRAGYGLLGMRARVRPWNGSVDVRPGPLGGTVVEARIRFDWFRHTAAPT
ncbi:MAG: hypothetical protein EPO26_11045 [Chloroflexota bacterium]|nr:MAG: hypothetical protein EPO26_11045 [Chloroflexota bacterium]